jgi:hypothetical protein
MIILENRPFESARVYGIFIHGKENVALIKKFGHSADCPDMYMRPITLKGKIYEQAVILYSHDEFAVISLGGNNLSWGHWNSREDLLKELKEWTERPGRKILKETIRKAGLIQQRKGRVICGQNHWEGPDWFVFDEKFNP